MIPLPMLWGTSLKLVKKIASTVVLCAGVFVLVCSLPKTIFVIVVCYENSPSPSIFFLSSNRGRISLILLYQQDPINVAQLAGE
jgi:hypothetical protein